MDSFFDRIEDMFQTVSAQGHGSIILVFILGILFGSILQYTRVHKFEKIAGFAMLRDTVIPKMLFLAIGLASIGLYFMVKAGYASYHIKPLIVGGLIIGGTIFGIGMAILGKCPGTGPISIAEGRIDVLVGAIGGVIAGALFSVYFEEIKVILGPNLGKLTLLNSVSDSSVTILIFGIVITLVALFIPLREEIDENDPGYRS